jgi:signal transduction histidine kinase
VDDQPLPVLSVYPQQLTVACKNLLHNAIAYSLPDAQGFHPITITGYHVGDDRYALEISNVGLEIAPDDIASGVLFAPHYRGARAQQVAASGSGLGLTSVQQVAKNHQGEVRVHSEQVAAGLHRNTFCLVLPMAAA